VFFFFLLADSGDESLRYAGCILLVLIDYTNMVSFDTSYFEYSISVRRVLNTEFKTDQLQFTTFPQEYNYWNRHGIRLLFLRRGTVGTFDFQTMLINIIAGSALVRPCYFPTPGLFPLTFFSFFLSSFPG